jgi:hypothetical protein
LLRSKYPTPAYRIYGKEIREGYQTPCFFTEIMDKGSRAETKNFAKGGITIKITYFQEVRNEVDQLEKTDEIKELFGLIFCVEGRCLTVGEFEHEYIGEYQDILQISINIDYLEHIQKEESAPIAREAGIRVTEG